MEYLNKKTKGIVTIFKVNSVDFKLLLFFCSYMYGF